MLEVQQGAYSLQQRHNNINTNTTNTNITNNNNNTVAAGIDNKIEKGAVILRNSTTVEINSFFYVHVPKTGRHSTPYCEIDCQVAMLKTSRALAFGAAVYGVITQRMEKYIIRSARNL